MLAILSSAVAVLSHYTPLVVVLLAGAVGVACANVWWEGQAE